MSMTREEYKKLIFGQSSSAYVHKIKTKYIKSLEAQLKAKDKEINHLKYLLHPGDEHGAEINLRICNKYVSKRFSRTEICEIILLDQYLKDTFENMLEMLKDNA